MPKMMCHRLDVAQRPQYCSTFDQAMTFWDLADISLLVYAIVEKHRHRADFFYCLPYLSGWIKEASLHPGRIASEGSL